MLTDEERRLAHAAFYQGPAVLIEEGWDSEQLRTFFEREDVQFELSLLKRELDLHDGLKARAKFYARRSLHRMVDPAMAVVAQSLGGPEYVRDKTKGTIMRDSRGLPLLKQPDVTQGQRWAADRVLDGVGLGDFRITMDPGIDNNVELLFKKAETPRTIETEGLGQTDEERTLSRERVRTAIEQLIPALPAAREAFDAEFTEIVRDGRGGKRKAKPKRSPKKAAGKKKKAARKPSTRRDA